MSHELSPPFRDLLLATGKQALSKGNSPVGFGADGKKYRRSRDGGRYSITADVYSEGGHDKSLDNGLGIKACFTAMAKLTILRYDPDAERATLREDWLTDDGRVFEARAGTESGYDFLSESGLQALLDEIIEFNKGITI